LEFPSIFRNFQERCVKLTVEQASEFLRRKSNDCKVAMEIVNLSSGPMIVLCLARENAVELWKQLMGPENCLLAKKSAPSSLRALYGDSEDVMKNAVYGSESEDDVGHELQFFFPNSEQANMKMSFANHFSCPSNFFFFSSFSDSRAYSHR
jgi:nucleoside diphosphate kinase